MKTSLEKAGLTLAKEKTSDLYNESEKEKHQKGVDFGDDLIVVLYSKAPRGRGGFRDWNGESGKHLGLSPAGEKTAVALIMSRRKKNTGKVEVGGYTVVSKTAIK